MAANNNKAQLLMLLNQVTNLENQLRMPGMAQNQIGLNPANLMAFMNKSKLAKGQTQTSNKNMRVQATPNAGPNLAGLLSAMAGGNTTERTRCIWITGLPEKYQDADKLTKLFGNFGNVQRVKFTDKKPDGALIELDDARGAMKAVWVMNKQKLDGNTLKVSFSKLERAGFIKEDDAKSKLVWKAKENWRFASKDKESKFRRICLSRLRILSNKVIVSNLPEGKMAQLKKYIVESGFTVKSIEGSKRSDEEGKPSSGYTMAIVELADVEEAIAAVATLHNTWPIK
jgi:RNA recognition motif-containing protein